ncbi:hypothetical protein DM860_004252 [Cuscuta australis]|uniref:Uncharacterized protein n=1 Tax=Cuscuta australis TaxID=267555 RepID=A0A328EBD0_9ASTE|nr:hypothetical protein DM860_004252 [Cuscuta australis]
MERSLKSVQGQQPEETCNGSIPKKVKSSPKRVQEQHPEETCNDKCNKASETADHLFSSCSSFAKDIYQNMSRLLQGKMKIDTEILLFEAQHFGFCVDEVTEDGATSSLVERMKLNTDLQILDAGALGLMSTGVIAGIAAASSSGYKARYFLDGVNMKLQLFEVGALGLLSADMIVGDAVASSSLQDLVFS